MCSWVHLIPSAVGRGGREGAGELIPKPTSKWSVARSTTLSCPSQNDRASSVGKVSPLEHAGSVGWNDRATILRGHQAVARLLLEIVPRDRSTANDRSEGI